MANDLYLYSASLPILVFKTLYSQTVFPVCALCLAALCLFIDIGSVFTYAMPMNLPSLRVFWILTCTSNFLQWNVSELKLNRKWILQQVSDPKHKSFLQPRSEGIVYGLHTVQKFSA